MTQANDLPSRMSQAADNIIDLRLAASALLQATDKNSSDAADLIEVNRRLVETSRQNSEQISVLLDSQTRTDQAIHDICQSTASINAAIKRMDRLLDYLIRRNQGRSL